MSYIERLISSCEKAKAAAPKQIIVIDNLSRSSDATSLSGLNGINEAIYTIEEVDGDPERTFLAFSKYKGTKDRACAKLNGPSKVMYVGSSTTGVKKRIEQHMGMGDRRTYALHLSHWFEGKYKVTVTQYDVPDEVLQILEDDLADSLEPAFGKRGANNR